MVHSTIVYCLWMVCLCVYVAWKLIMHFILPFKTTSTAGNIYTYTYIYICVCIYIYAKYIYIYEWQWIKYNVRSIWMLDYEISIYASHRINVIRLISDDLRDDGTRELPAICSFLKSSRSCARRKSRTCFQLNLI